MSGEESSHENVFSWQDIAARASNWNLSCDAELLKHMEASSKSTLKSSQEVDEKLKGLDEKLKKTSLKLDLARNEFSSLSNVQFIESRVYEEDETAFESSKDETNDIKPEENTKQELIEAAKAGLAVLEKHYDRINVPESDSEDEEIPNFILRPKDPYINRPLPHVIGSEEWYKSSNAGMSDSSSESEDENVSEKYSEDEEPSKDENVGGLNNESANLETGETSDDEGESWGSKIGEPVAHSTLNYKRKNLEGEGSDFRVEKGVDSQTSFAEQLAEKLGNVINANINRQNDLEEDVTVNKRPIRKPISDYGRLFSNEPPPIDDEDLFTNNASKGLFSDKHKLFDDSTSPPINNEDLFSDTSSKGLFSDKHKLFDDSTSPPINNEDLFSDTSSKGLFSDKHKLFDDSTSPPINNEDLFSDNASKGLFSDKHKLFDDSTSPPINNEDLFSDTSSKGLFSDKHKLFDDSTSPPINNEDLFSDNASKGLFSDKHKLFDDSTSNLSEDELFADNNFKGKSTKKQLEVKKHNLFDDSDEEIPVKKQQTKKGLFDDSDEEIPVKKQQPKKGLFDDSDEEIPVKKQQPKKRLFDDSDEEIPVKKQQTKKGLFDEEDEDIFASKESGNNNNNPSKEIFSGENKYYLFNDDDVVIKKEQTKKSLFDEKDDDDDDIFNTKKSSNVNSKESKKYDLFNSNETTGQLKENLFETKGAIKKDPGYKSKKTPRLFSDSDSDDLFSTKPKVTSNKIKDKKEEKQDVSKLRSDKEVKKLKKGLFDDESEDDNNNLFGVTKKTNVFKGDKFEKIVKEDKSKEIFKSIGKETTLKDQSEEIFKSIQPEKTKKSQSDEIFKSLESEHTEKNQPEEIFRSLEPEKTKKDQSDEILKELTQRKQDTEKKSQKSFPNFFDDIPSTKNIFDERDEEPYDYRNSCDDVFEIDPIFAINDSFKDIFENVEKSNEIDLHNDQKEINYSKKKLNNDRKLNDFKKKFNDGMEINNDKKGINEDKKEINEGKKEINKDKKEINKDNEKKRNVKFEKKVHFLEDYEQVFKNVNKNDEKDVQDDKKNEDENEEIDGIVLAPESASFSDYEYKCSPDLFTDSSCVVDDSFPDVFENDEKDVQDDKKNEDENEEIDGIVLAPKSASFSDYGYKCSPDLFTDSSCVVDDSFPDVFENDEKDNKKNQYKNEEIASPGKLKHNLNINVHALLPGAAPFKRGPTQPQKSTSLLDISSGEGFVNQDKEKTLVLPRFLKSKSQDEDSKSQDEGSKSKDNVEQVEVLQSVTKSRARIPNRRPSTKRGREAFRKSCIEFSTPKDEEIEEETNEAAQITTVQHKKSTHEDLFGPDTDDEDFFKNLQRNESNLKGKSSGESSIMKKPVIKNVKKLENVPVTQDDPLNAFDR